MAKKIQLTPAELLAQSREMLSLRDEYEAIFKSSQAVLSTVNGNWSACLSRNFLGKLSSAEKGFSQILGMLENGGNLAAQSANSYESVDSLLSKQILGGEAEWGQDAALLVQGAISHAAQQTIGIVEEAAAAKKLSEEEREALEKELDEKMRGIVSSGVNTFTDQLEHDWEMVQSGLEDVENLYNQLPQGVQDVWEWGVDTFAGTWATGWDIFRDIVKGDGWGAWDKFVKSTSKKAYKLGEYIFCGGMLEDAGNVGHWMVDTMDSLLPDSVDNWFEETFGIGIVESWESGWAGIGEYWSDVGDYWGGKLNDFADGVSDFFGGLFG